MVIDFSRSTTRRDDDAEEIERKAKEVQARVQRAQQEAKEMIARTQAQVKKARLDEHMAQLQAEALLEQAHDMHKQAMRAQSDAQALENKADTEMLNAAAKTIKTVDTSSPDFSL